VYGRCEWRATCVDIPGESSALFLQAMDLVGDVGRRVVLGETQLLDLRLELGNRALEIQERCLHSGKSPEKQAIIVPQPGKPAS
jgi:hypothetical protein